METVVPHFAHPVSLILKDHDRPLWLAEVPELERVILAYRCQSVQLVGIIVHIQNKVGMSLLDLGHFFGAQVELCESLISCKCN